MIVMEFKDKLRKLLEIPKTTEDGFKYYIVSDENNRDEIKIVGFSHKFTATSIPSHIEGIPVGILSGLQGVPLKGEIYIPDTVHTIENLGLDITKGITKIVVPSSVKYIGRYAFDFSQALEEIIFNDTDETECGLSLSDAESALNGCTKLKRVQLPDMIAIPMGFLSDCESLEYIHIPETVLSIDDCAFSYCENLKEIDFPEFLEEIGEMAFFDCKSLEYVQLPENVDFIGKSAFWGCENLREIRIPSGMKRICKDAFGNCPKLVRPVIPEGCSVDPKAFG